MPTAADAGQGQPQDVGGHAEQLISTDMSGAISDDPKVEIPASELDLLRSCQKIIDAARSMCCAQCGKVFETIDFYEHIFVREECRFDSMDEEKSVVLTSTEKREHEQVLQRWHAEKEARNILNNDNSELKQFKPFDMPMQSTQ